MMDDLVIAESKEVFKGIEKAVYIVCLHSLICLHS